MGVCGVGVVCVWCVCVGVGVRAPVVGECLFVCVIVDALMFVSLYSVSERSQAASCSGTEHHVPFAVSL